MYFPNCASNLYICFIVPRNIDTRYKMIKHFEIRAMKHNQTTNTFGVSTPKVQTPERLSLCTSGKQSAAKRWNCR